MKRTRESIVVKTSIISIISNFLLAGFKAMVGLASNSIAIIIDAVNNLSDALSSVVTIIGTKLAGKAPDRKHPYGYGRIEYVTSLVVSALVLYAGITACVESVKKIVNPEEVDYSIVTLLILVVGIVVKIVLGLYVKKKGSEVNSDSLVASGSDAFNDAILSISVLLSAIIFMIFKIDFEAYVGVVVSIYIIKSGIELIRNSVDNMLGMRVEGKLSKAIKREIAKEDGVQGVFDLVLNDYGPDKYLGSVHIEVLDTMSVSDVDRISRRVTKRVADKFGVILHAIGVYSVNTNDKEVLDAKKEIESIVFENKEVLQMHGFYFDDEQKMISFDIIIDFKADRREDVYKKIYDDVKRKFKGFKINITLDVDASD